VSHQGRQAHACNSPPPFFLSIFLPPASRPFPSERCPRRTPARPLTSARCSTRSRARSRRPRPSRRSPAKRRRPSFPANSQRNFPPSKTGRGLRSMKRPTGRTSCRRTFFLSLSRRPPRRSSPRRRSRLKPTSRPKRFRVRPNLKSFPLPLRNTGQSLLSGRPPRAKRPRRKYGPRAVSLAKSPQKRKRCRRRPPAVTPSSGRVDRTVWCATKLKAKTCARGRRRAVPLRPAKIRRTGLELPRHSPRISPSSRLLRLSRRQTRARRTSLARSSKRVRRPQLLRHRRPRAPRRRRLPSSVPRPTRRLSRRHRMRAAPILKITKRRRPPKTSPHHGRRRPMRRQTTRNELRFLQRASNIAAFPLRNPIFPAARSRRFLLNHARKSSSPRPRHPRPPRRFRVSKTRTHRPRRRSKRSPAKAAKCLGQNLPLLPPAGRKRRPPSTKEAKKIRK